MADKATIHKSAEEKTPATILQDIVIQGVNNSLKCRRDAFISGPTGSGKTRMFTMVAGDQAAKGKDVIVLANRINLIIQSQKDMEKWYGNDVSTSIGYNGQIDQTGKVVYSTVQTAHELKDDLKKYSVAIFDEAHHLLEKNKDFMETIDALIKKNPDILLVPVSATPPEGYEGLHPRIKASDKHIITFEEALQANLVRLPETRTPAMIYNDHRRIEDVVKKHRKNETSAELEGGISKELSKMRGEDWAEQLVNQYERHLIDKKTLAFFDSIKEANAFVNEALSRGHPVAAIHSGQSLKENDRLRAAFESGHIKALASVDMISEGYDIDCNGILLEKKTTSLTEYRQIIGRETRGHGVEGGEKSILVDTGASTFIHGNIAAQAQMQTARGGLERGTTSKDLYLPDTKTDKWKPWVEMKVPGTERTVWGTSIGNAVIYAARTDTGYATFASRKDKKGSRVDLLEIEGQKKGRPTKEALSEWISDAIQTSGKNLAALTGRKVGQKTELEHIVSEDWKRNAASIERSIEMLTAARSMQSQALMSKRQISL